MYKGKVLIFVLIMGIFPFSFPFPSFCFDIGDFIDADDGNSYQLTSSESSSYFCSDSNDDLIAPVDTWHHYVSYEQDKCLIYESLDISAEHDCDKSLSGKLRVYRCSFVSSTSFCDDSKMLCQCSSGTSDGNFVYGSYVIKGNSCDSDKKLVYRDPVNYDLNQLIEDGHDVNLDERSGFNYIDCFCADLSSGNPQLSNGLQLNEFLENLAVDDTSPVDHDRLDHFECAEQCYPCVYRIVDGYCECVPDPEDMGTVCGDGTQSDRSVCSNECYPCAYNVNADGSCDCIPDPPEMGTTCGDGTTASTSGSSSSGSSSSGSSPVGSFYDVTPNQGQFTEATCKAHCSPHDYFYNDGICLCDTPPPPHLSNPPSVQTADNPSDSNDLAGWASSIKQNIDNLVSQNQYTNEALKNLSDVNSSGFSKLSNSANTLNENLSRGLGKLDRIDSGINSLGDSFGEGFGNLGDKLDAIKNNQEQGYEVQGTSDLPSDNQYDSTVETVEEDSFADALGNYLSSSIPILSYIRGTSLQLSGASSSMSVNLWGETIEFDLAPMADILDTMGYILSGIAVIVAFGIIVGRG